MTGERPQRGQLRRPRVPEECPQEVSDLLFECVREDPAARPTAGQLVQRLGEHLRQHSSSPAEQAARAPVRNAAAITVPGAAWASPFAAQAETPFVPASVRKSVDFLRRSVSSRRGFLEGKSSLTEA